ncbi:MAG: ATP-binding protein [Cyclobacteriaceae bacterium]
MKLMVSITRVALLLFFILSYKMVFSQTGERVLMLADKDGLPQNKVKGILNDQHGYIWIGTQNGVAKYDGYTFKNYPELNGKEISKLYISKRNDLWIGTHSGLYMLDRIRDEFTQISLGDIRDITEAEGHIYFITPDNLYGLEEERAIIKYEIETSHNLKQLVYINGIFYLGLGSKQGILSIRTIEGKVLNSEQNLDDHLPNHVITCLRMIDNKLWAGTSEGYVFEQIGKQFRRIDINNSYSIKDIIRLNGATWVATDGNGVFVLDSGRNAVNHYYDDPNSKSILGSNNIHSMMKMPNGDLWMGTYDAGICYLSSQSTQFKNMADTYKSKQVPLNRNATASFEDSDKNLWLGTQTGFMKINTRENDIRTIGFDTSQKLLGGSKVLAIHESRNKEMWVGTYDGGLGHFSKDMRHLATYFPFSDGLKREQNINFILPYSKNQILINSMYKGIGVFNIENREISKIPLVASDTIWEYHTQAVRQFDKITYAYVFGKDLCAIDEGTKTLKAVLTPTHNVNDFLKNRDNTFWLATRGAGLLLMDTEGQVLKHLDLQDGLPSNFLLRIEKDHLENLWVTSISGLAKIDVNDNITLYDHRHGLPSKEFSPFVSTILHNNNLLFGTVAGFVMTNPNEQLNTSFPPKVVISDITFQNKSVKTLVEEIPLDQPIESLQTIELPFDRNSFTIHFFNNDYDLPKYNTFQYRMKGLEKEWINLHEHTHTTYTNLLPGTYQFQVNSTNKYNVKGLTPTTLNITIMPPWYLSKWAYGLYVLIFMCLIYVIYRVILYRAHVKKELEFSEFKVEAIKDLNEKKLKFFTNITHDFKTPLTLISAPLESLLKDSELNKETRDLLNLIKRNSDRLHHLIIDLLDFRKISNEHKLTLEASKTDLNRFFLDLFEPFNSACLSQNITLSLDNQCSEPAYFDNEKVKRIMWNVLSNSLKFTPKNGKIAISCSTDESDSSKLRISVRDSGKGLTSEEIDHLFDRYYQGSTARQGTGLGLSIVDGLVKAQRGEISIYSTPGEGAEFVITIPFRKKDYKDVEIISKPRGNYQFIPDEDRTNQEETVDVPNAKYNLPVLLIAEDNYELNAFLASIFQSQFKVLSCRDGQEALTMAQKKAPDLIISDVLMPNMDGYELCEKIKSDLTTSHIPVILLTANSSLDEQVKGMKRGADVYITKPFKTEFLVASVNSVLDNREKLRAKFQLLDHVNEDEDDLSTQDQEFINKLKNYINQNIDNQGLSVDSLSDHMNCSKSSLIRKVKGLTGLTPMAFLRTFRLNTAYEALMQNNLSVSEVSYKTGFSDPNYFTTCFKKQFGKNPSQV